MSDDPLLFPSPDKKGVFEISDQGREDLANIRRRISACISAAVVPGKTPEETRPALVAALGVLFDQFIEEGLLIPYEPRRVEITVTLN